MGRTEDLDGDDADDLQTEGQDELLADLKWMANNSEKSDVAFICSDGEAVHGCRWFLANRSPAFQIMFSKETSESSLSEIPMSAISSQVMLSVVEFLYTGKIVSYPIDDWQMGFEMVWAAQFFMIPTLELIAQDYLRKLALDACVDEYQEDLTKMLDVAVDFEEPWRGKDGIMRELIFHLHDDLFGTHFDCELSRDVADLILGYSRRELDKVASRPSMEEYCVFRNIVLWHVKQVARDKVNKAREETLPPRKSLWSKMLEMPDIDGFIADVSDSMDFSDSTAVLNSLLGVKIHKSSLEQMLHQHVKLSCIPISLLLTVIHPLKLFSPKVLLKALICGSPSRRVRRSTFRSDWLRGMPDLSIRIEPDGCISRRGDTREDTNIMFAQVPHPTPSDTYEWNFTILDDNVYFIDLGFICLPHGESIDDVEDDGKTLRDFSNTRILCINKKNQTTSISREEPKSNWDTWEELDIEVQLNSVVNFSFDESQRTCHVSFGDDIEAVWYDLPVGRYHPAVCFNNCLSAMVQFSLGSGFDYF